MGTSTSPYANATGDGLAAQALAYAGRFLGVPYVWGGASPAGFDCSGLVQYAYDKMGIHLPRTAAEQSRTGTRIPVSAAQPGDLIFFSYAGGKVDHVALAAGGGQDLQAPHTGAVVRREAIDYRHALFAVREVAGGGGSRIPAATPASSTTGSTGATGLPIGWHVPGLPWDIPTPGDAVRGVEGAAAGIDRAITRAVIVTPIVLGGVVLAVYGLARTAGVDTAVRRGVDQTKAAAVDAAQVAAVVA